MGELRKFDNKGINQVTLNVCHYSEKIMGHVNKNGKVTIRTKPDELYV